MDAFPNLNGTFTSKDGVITFRFRVDIAFNAYERHIHDGVFKELADEMQGAIGPAIDGMYETKEIGVAASLKKVPIVVEDPQLAELPDDKVIEIKCGDLRKMLRRHQQLGGAIELDAAEVLGHDAGFVPREDSKPPT